MMETPRYGGLLISLPESLAAVDLGSHSFHLLVAQPQAGELVVVDRLREKVQLAAGLNPARRLSAESRRRGLDCLRRLGQRLRHIPAPAVRAVGTNTLRSAKNAREFLREAREVLGHPIETISGMEEARLIFLGVAHSLANPASRFLVVDIGGGSTEVIIGEGFQPIHMESLYLGCVNLSRSFFKKGEMSSSRWRRAEVAARIRSRGCA
jgi:exopolyphosphatase/guanosine-5'-triphosphate,3'-diphosphate pyrophosphatase